MRDHILTPLTINGMQVPNRTVVPAMVTRLSGEDGYVNQAIIDRYVSYAKGDVGLIIVEAMAIHQSKSGPLLRISDDKFIEGHRKLTDAIHRTSQSKVVPQIIHFMKVARSGWRQTIDMLSEDDITAIIRDFGDAALRAKEAGYDGVELHSAHAYTLSSFLSRHNKRRDRYDGRSLEGRLRMFGDVMAEVRSKVGKDFPIGVRFLADEMIKDGYTLEDSRLIALRMAQLGVDYISLSVGGKFEDAILQDGLPPYPYTGYSGERCMPGASFPKMPHIHYAAAIKEMINAKGFDIPVISVGKINAPEDAERLLAEGKADMIGMARQLLADPNWPKKVAQDREQDIVTCIYCNVCKQLDEKFKEVTCFLWPKGYLQAPDYNPDMTAPAWEDDSPLNATYVNGAVKLKWTRASGEVSGYDLYRTEDNGAVEIIEAKKGGKFDDKTVLGGLKYSYYIRAYNKSGQAGPPSNVVELELPIEDFLPQQTAS
ncbi:NADH:flavin oxidoreductase [Paremcibacter congregatus]|uniref:oxidoreductase n=1 Tax=Paremcibacter congregatus TaxID=2043170 RepID=UPI003A91323B